MKIFTASCIILLFSQLAVLSQNDTLVTNNGNMIVGEIKNMARGVLQIETDYSDSDFKIDWSEVKIIKSDRTFVFFNSSGKHFDGSIRMDENDSSKVILFNTVAELSVKIINVVIIKPIETGFWGKFSLELAAG